MTASEPTPPMSRFLRFTVGYTAYFLTVVVFVGLFVPLIAALAPFPSLARRAANRIVTGYLRFLTLHFLPALGICRISEIAGQPAGEVPGAPPVVYCANHRGRLDALLLLALLPRAGCVIKAKYVKLPLYAALVRFARFISASPSSFDGMALAIQRCTELLATGHDLLVFPEGTRTAGARLLPFRDLAFRVALAANVPIQPVIIHPSYPFMSRRPGSIYPRMRVFYRVRFLAPEYPNPNDTPAELLDRVRRRMTAELRRLDAGTVWETTPAPLQTAPSTALHPSKRTRP